MHVLMIQKDVINDSIMAVASIKDDQLNQERKITLVNGSEQIATASIGFVSRIIGCKSL